MLEPNKNFRVPNKPPSHTGWCWRNRDGSIGIEITDLFLAPINLVGVKEGDRYYLRGWRGNPPEEIRIPFIDDDSEKEEPVDG